MDSGKVSREFFEEYVHPYTGADRGDVLLGPTHGADFGAVDLGGGRVLAMASDPLFVLRELGVERAAWFAFHILVSDVALSGLPPAYLTVDCNLPVDADPGEFGAIWRVFHEEAESLGVSIVSGHTGAYEGCSYPTIGGGTAFAVGDAEDVVYPTGAAPGDRVVVTKGPAVETTGVLSVLFGEHLPDDVAAGRERFEDVSPVRDALVAAAAGPVSAMHDATERGVHNALHELATASGVRLDVERERFPVSPGVREVCSFFEIDPWVSSSEGTVVLTVPPEGVDSVLAALDDEGVRAAEVGVVEAGEGVVMDGEALAVPDHDPLWDAYKWGLAEFGAPSRD